MKPRGTWSNVDENQCWGMTGRVACKRQVGRHCPKDRKGDVDWEQLGGERHPG